MKFLELQLENFRPYYKKIGINFYDEDGAGNITVNVGKTGYGKTSLNEALQWCIYGNDYRRDWDVFLNNFAERVANQKGEEEVKMSVQLKTEVGGETYNLLRTAIYDLENDRKDDINFEIKKEGELIPDPEGFVNDYFLPVSDWMKYFITDAEEVRALFREDPSEPIKTHMDRIAGVGKLDRVIDVLEKTENRYDSRKREVEGAPEEYANILNRIEEMEEAISEMKEEIEEREQEKNEKIEKIEELSKQGLEGAKEYIGLLDEKEELKEGMEELNQKFCDKEINGESLSSKIYYLFLTDIVDSAIRNMRRKKPSEEEFSTTLDVVKSALEDKYDGIVLRDGEYLLEDASKIDESDMSNINELDLVSGQRGANPSLLENLNTVKGVCEEVENSFNEFKNIKEKAIELSRKRSKLDRFGEELDNEEIREKIENINRLKGEIEDRKKTIKEIKQNKDPLTEEKDELEKDSDKFNELNKKIEKTRELRELMEVVREKYVENIIDTVNKEGSEFLRSTVENETKWNSIKLKPDYSFNIYRADGERIPNPNFNTGNEQLALLSFFFGISEYLAEDLGKEIPYVIDAPFMRLDPGHKRRLIERFGEEERQVIMQMIPQGEYNKQTYESLKPHLSIQNWLVKGKERGGLDEISHVEQMPSDQMIKWEVV